MGGKSTPGPQSNVTGGETADQSTLASLVNQQTQQSEQLYSLTEPGLAQSENWYQSLASGDPGSIMRAIAPTAQAANQAATGARANIMANDPSGGEKNLALEQVDVNRAGQIASTASSASTGANNALGQLAGQGIGESQQGASTAAGALGTSLSGWNSLGGLQLQGQQLQMEQKGQELGAFGGLAGDAGEAAMCPCAGSLILMADGTQLPVEFIRRGDYVRDINGYACRVESVSSRLEETIRTTMADGRAICSSLSHTFIAPDASFIVAFESLGYDVVAADGPVRVANVQYNGHRRVYSLRTGPDSSHTYQVDGVWALGVGDQLSDDYINSLSIRREMTVRSVVYSLSDRIAMARTMARVMAIARVMA